MKNSNSFIRLVKGPFDQLHIATLAHLAYWVMLAFAVAWYQERLFTEPTNDIFSVINEHTVWLVNNRFVLILSQWLPLIGIILSLPLKAVLILYSFSEMLFFYLAFLFAAYYLKKQETALAVFVVSILSILYTFFLVPMSEIWYGSVLLVLFYSMLQTFNRNHRLPTYIFYIIMFFTAYSHPIITALLPFALLYDYLSNKATRDPVVYILPAVFMLLVLIGLNGYEMSEIQHHFSPAISPVDYLEWFYIQQLVLFFLSKYYLAFLLVILGIAWLVKRANYKAALLTGLSFAVVLLLMHHRASLIYNVMQGWLEIYYIPLFAIAAIPFFFDFYPQASPGWKKNISVMLLLAAGLQISQIAALSKIYGQRIDAIGRINEYVQDMPGEKFYFSAENFKYSQPFYSWWTIPVESMFFSSIAYGKDNMVNLCPVESKYFEHEMNIADSCAVRALEGMPFEYEFLNDEYFEIETGAFIKLNQNRRNISPEYFKNIEVDLLEPHKMEILKEDGIIFYKDLVADLLPVTIFNDNMDPLYSGPRNKIYLSYQWLLNDDTVQHEAVLTPLELDVIDEYDQYLAVFPPLTPGDYTLVYDLVRVEGEIREGVRYKWKTSETSVIWLGCGNAVDIEVRNNFLYGFF